MPAPTAEPILISKLRQTLAKGGARTPLQRLHVADQQQRAVWTRQHQIGARFQQLAMNRFRQRIPYDNQRRDHRVPDRAHCGNGVGQRGLEALAGATYSQATINADRNQRGVRYALDEFIRIRLGSLDSFAGQMRKATLLHLSQSETARRDLAENYIGLPY